MAITLGEAHRVGKRDNDCFCCGMPAPESTVVRLSRHNEVRVCFACLDWLNVERSEKRARARRSQFGDVGRKARLLALRGRFAQVMTEVLRAARRRWPGHRGADRALVNYARRHLERGGSRAAAILKTTDMAATVRWYRLAGFRIRAQLPARGEPTWCEVQRDDLVLQFLAADRTPWPDAPTFTGCFYVHPASVTAVYAELSPRLDIEWGIEERPWGARELVLRDPNGYFITFTEPL